MATNILKEQYDKLQQENEQYNKLISQQKDHLDSLDKEVNYNRRILYLWCMICSAMWVVEVMVIMIVVCAVVGIPLIADPNIYSQCLILEPTTKKMCCCRYSYRVNCVSYFLCGSRSLWQRAGFKRSSQSQVASSNNKGNTARTGNVSAP